MIKIAELKTLIKEFNLDDDAEIIVSNKTHHENERIQSEYDSVSVDFIKTRTKNQLIIYI